MSFNVTDNGQHIRAKLQDDEREFLFFIDTLVRQVGEAYELKPRNRDPVATIRKKDGSWRLYPPSDGQGSYLNVNIPDAFVEEIIETAEANNRIVAGDTIEAAKELQKQE